MAAPSPLDSPMDLEVTPGPRRVFGIPQDDPPFGDRQAESTGRPLRPLSMGEVRHIVQREISNALGATGSKIAEDRRLAIRMYHGRPIGNEIKDRSQVVSRDVLETVEWAMPSLMKMFTSGNLLARFKPSSDGPQKAQDAEIATVVLNRMFTREMKGERILYDWFKTGLLEKTGIVKVYWEERVEPKVRSLKGLDENQLAVVLMEAKAEGGVPVSFTEYEHVVEGQLLPVYDIDIRVLEHKKGVRVDGVPPEEFMIARRVIELDDDCPFSGHRKKFTVSELVSLGYPYEVVSIIPNDDTPEYSEVRTERLAEDEQSYPNISDERSDAAARTVWASECYIRIDEDGDGMTELRKILLVGGEAGEIIADDYINRNPFVNICPIPTPHKFHGLSVADLVMDLQVIRSTLMRQILDHLYLANNPRLAVVEGMVNLNDLLTVRPGGLIRQRAVGQIEPIQLPQLPGEAFKALEYLAEVRNERTGVIAHGAELDASAINTTATGMSVVSAEKAQKIELIARLYAMGIKELFTKMLQLLVENDSKDRQIEIAGDWIKYNPGTWDAGMDLDIEVGLGAGKATERLGNLGQIMSVQEKLVAGGKGHMVSDENLFNSATELTEISGFKDTARFFTSPEGKEPPPQQPDPEVLKLKLESLKAQGEAELNAGKIQLDAQKQQDLQEFRLMEMAMNERLKTLTIQSQERNALGTQDATVESAGIAAQATVGAARIAAGSRRYANDSGASASA